MTLLTGIGLKTILFPVFVIIAIILGLVLAIHLPIATGPISTYGIPFGLFFMIYPAMTKIRMNELGRSFREAKTIGLMVFLNYAIAPFLVAGLGYFFFYFVFLHFGLLSPAVTSQVLVGIILLGVAPCIAMVMVWTNLAHGNMSKAVSFVAWNSIIQVITTPFLVYILARTSVVISPYLILESVLLYLAIPLIAGILTRRVLQKKAYFSKVLNTLGTVQTLALLFTILVIFWSEGKGIISYPSLIWMVGVVMVAFYFVLFHVGYFTARRARYDYPDSTAIGFTVSARDFEVSIAIAVVAFSSYPYVAVTTAIGPLLEIPLMLFLVWIQLGRESKHKVVRIQRAGVTAK